MSLYKFAHIPLLKNDTHLKQKSDKQPKKKYCKDSICNDPKRILDSHVNKPKQYNL